MSEKKKITKSIAMSPRHMEMIEEIDEKYGRKTFTAHMLEAFTLYYRKMMPDYIHQDKKKSKTPEERAREQVALSRAKEKQKKDDEIERRTNICVNELGGEVVKNESGVLVCRFYQYDDNPTGKGDFLQEQPIETVNVNVHAHQFYPSKQKVFEKRPDVAEKFKNSTIK